MVRSLGSLMERHTPKPTGYMQRQLQQNECARRKHSFVLSEHPQPQSYVAEAGMVIKGIGRGMRPLTKSSTGRVFDASDSSTLSLTRKEVGGDDRDRGPALTVFLQDRDLGAELSSRT